MQVLSLCRHKDVDAYDAGTTAEAFCRLCTQLADDEEMVMECYAEMVRTLAAGGVEIAGILVGMNATDTDKCVVAAAVGLGVTTYRQRERLCVGLLP